jgi:hypothetical protein
MVQTEGRRNGTTSRMHGLPASARTELAPDDVLVWAFGYLLNHRHEPEECGVAFAAFNGHDSALRHAAAVSSCVTGGHEICWVVDAPDGVEPRLSGRGTDPTRCRRR